MPSWWVEADGGGKLMRRTRRPRRVRSATGARPPSRWQTLDPEIRGDLDDLAKAIGDLSSNDLERLIAFWETVDPAARDAAHDHGQEAAVRTGRRDVIHALQEEIIVWGGPSQAARAGNVEWWIPIDNQQYGRRKALPALLDTALALTVQDELDDKDFETLFGPWRDAMGDPDDEADEPAGTPGEPAAG
jgi:hypothetical protein